MSFIAPTWAVWVNGLWFSSLVISITCAVLATLLQQWARRYLKVAYPRYSPHKRARIRAFYAKGVDRLHLPWMVELLPALLHISLFLFFSGLAVLMFNINPSIFKAVIVLVGLCIAVYAFLTILPILHMDSPYSTPLTALVSFCLTGMRSAFHRLIHWHDLSGLNSTIITRLCNCVSTTAHPEDFSHGMCKAPEQFALQLGPEIDYESLLWMFESLDDDKELEQFFEGVPGLCGSKAVPSVQVGVIKRHEKKFSSALIEFINRTLSSSLVSDSVKRRRINICTNFIDATSLLGPGWTLRRVLLGDWERFLGCIKFALFVKSWKSITHPVTFFYAECVAAITISSVKPRDGRWFQLAGGLLEASKHHLLNHSAHCDNIFFSNVIFIVRRTIQTYSGLPERHRGDILGASTKTLESLCKLDIKRTLPELQHEFCIVWNQLVGLAQNDERPYIICVSQMTLKNIRKLYIVLHKGTSAYPTEFSSSTDDGDPVLYDPRSYCICTLAEHRSGKVVPELRIEEPAQEVIGSGIHTPVIPGTNPASRSHSIFPPINPSAPVF